MKKALALLLLTLAACTQPPAPQTTAPAPSAFELRLAQDTPQAGMTAMVIDGTTNTIYVSSDRVLTASDVKDAKVVDPGNGQLSITVTLTDEAASRFADFTTANLGKRAAFLVGGRVVSAPRIMSPIRGGVAMIDGSFTNEEAARLAALLSPAH